MDGNREFIMMKMYNREMKFKNLLKVVSKTLSTAAQCWTELTHTPLQFSVGAVLEYCETAAEAIYNV